MLLAFAGGAIFGAVDGHEGFCGEPPGSSCGIVV
jgi:hypothetical protein